MREKEYLEWQTYKAIAAFFEQESEIINAVEVLKEDVAAFNALLTSINAKIEEQKSTVGVTASDKSALKQAIAEETRDFLFKIKAHAIKIQNADLMQLCKPSLTTLSNMPEVEFIDFTRQVVVNAHQLADVLAKYNVTAAQRTAYAESVETFANIGTQIKVANSKASVSSDNLKALFKQMKAFETAVLSVAVASVIETEPDFVKAYNDVRIGRTPSVNYTQVALSITDAEMLQPINKVNVEIPELKVKGTTDENGKFVVKTGSKREITVKISKTDWKSQEITVTKIIKGRTREVGVVLERALVEVQ